MFDPLSLGGAVMLTGYFANRNKCPVCRNIKLFSKWLTWTCCNVAQCPDCAATTQQNKSCCNCGSRVK